MKRLPAVRRQWPAIRPVCGSLSGTARRDSSCPTATWCLAVGGSLDIWDGRTWRGAPDPVLLTEEASAVDCLAPDDCLVAPDAWCTHGLASWRLILRALDDGGTV